MSERKIVFLKRGETLNHKALLHLDGGAEAPARRVARQRGDVTARTYLDPAYWDRGKCRACHKPPTPEGHDPCLGTLPGVSFACCGHGVIEGYVCFENGTVIRGLFEDQSIDETHPIVPTIRRWLARQKRK